MKWAWSRSAKQGWKSEVCSVGLKTSICRDSLVEAAVRSVTGAVEDAPGSKVLRSMQHVNTHRYCVFLTAGSVSAPSRSILVA